MAKVVEFCYLGQYGVLNRNQYPWDRWINGNTWGFCPEAFDARAKNFKKVLRETARNLEMSVEIEDHVINDEEWVTFRFSS